MPSDRLKGPRGIELQIEALLLDGLLPLAIEPSRLSDMTKISIDITPPPHIHLPLHTHLFPLLFSSALEQIMNTETRLLSTVKVANCAAAHAKSVVKVVRSHAPRIPM